MTRYDHHWLRELAAEWGALVFVHQRGDGAWQAFLMPFRFAVAN